MDLKTLKAKGGVISRGLVAKSVTWSHVDPQSGEQTEDTFEIHIVKHSFGSIERLYPNGSDRARGAEFIAQSVKLGDSGKESISYDEAYQLDPGLAMVFITAINEVNGTGGAAKNSQPPTSSGVNLSPTE